MHAGQSDWPGSAPVRNAPPGWPMVGDRGDGVEDQSPGHIFKPLFDSECGSHGFMTLDWHWIGWTPARNPLVTADSPAAAHQKKTLTKYFIYRHHVSIHLFTRSLAGREGGREANDEGRRPPADLAPRDGPTATTHAAAGGRGTAQHCGRKRKAPTKKMGSWRGGRGVVALAHPLTPRLTSGSPSGSSSPLLFSTLGLLPSTPPPRPSAASAEPLLSLAAPPPRSGAQSSPGRAAAAAAALDLLDLLPP
eukprot:9478068-Pyramimonas_sp.AAC.1